MRDESGLYSEGGNMTDLGGRAHVVDAPWLGLHPSFGFLRAMRYNERRMRDFDGSFGV